MSKLQPGTVQTFTVLGTTDHGYVLIEGNDEILVHFNDAAEEMERGDQVQAFLYQDKQKRMVATTYMPEIDFDTYGWCEVIEQIGNVGVFVDIGIPKHILVSSDDLPPKKSLWPKAEDKLYVRLDQDKSGRLIAKPATEEVIEGEAEPAPNELLQKPISGHVYRLNPHISAILTEEGYQGFIHYTERKEEPRLGQWVKGRVIEVKGVGSMNVSLRPLKEEALGEDAEAILSYLHENGGVMTFTDKSDPDAIRDTFQISKAAFKRAMGTLMKEKRIKQDNGSTYLITD